MAYPLCSRRIQMLFLYISAFIILLILAVSFWAYKKTFFSPKKSRKLLALPGGEQYEPYHDKMNSLLRELESIEGEEVSIISHDNKRLYAIYYHVKDGAPLQIEFHGYRGHHIRDFCGGNKAAREMGHNSLLIIQRAHDKSEGLTISFGVKERLDCLSWIKYANSRFGKDIPIFLVGVSMGAATVLMASELDLPENVVGIMADCPYSSPKAIIKKVCAQIGYPPALTFPFVRLGAILFGHFDPCSCSAENAVKNAKIPMLIFHGEDDRFVPVEMSKSIESNSQGRAKLYIFKNAGHGMSYMVNTELYNEITEKFVKNILDEYSKKA